MPQLECVVLSLPWMSTTPATRRRAGLQLCQAGLLHLMRVVALPIPTLNSNA